MHLLHSSVTLGFAVGSVLLTWAVVMPLIMGVGRTVWAGISLLSGSIGAARLGILPWLGIAGVLACLQILNCGLPIGIVALVLVIVWGVAGLWIGRREWRPMLRTLPTTSILLFAVLVLWSADRSIEPLKAFDSGLYHLQAIRWANTYPLVVGLGNLHGRLAFNNAGLLFDALLNVGPWHGRVEHICGGVFLLPLLWEACLGLTDRTRPLPYRTAAALLIVPCVMMLVSRDFASPTSDFLPSVLALALVLRAIDYAVDVHDDVHARGSAALVVVLIASAAVSTKLSVVAFAGSTAILVGLHRLYTAGRLREACVAVLLAALLLGPWLYRGAMLSGYPLYPSKVIALNVPWKVPATLVDVEREGVRVWGRQYYQLPSPIGQPTGWVWLKAWSKALPDLALFDVCVPLLAAAIAAVAMLVRRKVANPLVLWVTVVPAMVGLVFWFVTAPAPRFASSVFWGLGVGAVAAAGLVDVCSLIFSSAAVVALLLMVYRTYTAKATSKWNRTPAVFIPAGTDHGFGTRPTPDMVDYTTQSGLVVKIPRKGDQAWDSPLPSAPYRRPGLRLRHPGVLADGFVLDSDETLKP